MMALGYEGLDLGLNPPDRTEIHLIVAQSSIGIIEKYIV